MKNLITKLDNFINENSGHELITIPKRFDALRGACGDAMTPDDIIEEFNDAFQGDLDSDLVSYENGIFYFEDGTDSTPEDLFIQLDDLYRDED